MGVIRIAHSRVWLSQEEQAIIRSDTTVGRWEWLGLSLVALVSCTRFVNLGKESFWLDEAKGADFAFSPLEYWWDKLPSHHAPPGYFWVLRIVGWFSYDDAVLRFPSALAGCLAVLLLWGLLRRVDRRLAFVASLWLAVSPLHFHFSQEARCYALWILAELTVLASLVRWRDQPENKNLSTYCGLMLPLPLLFHYNALWFAIGRIPLLFPLLRKGGLAGWASFLSGALFSTALSLPWLIHQVFSMPRENPRVITVWSDLGLAFWNRKVGEFFGCEYPFQPLGWLVLVLALVGMYVRLSSPSLTTDVTEEGKGRENLWFDRSWTIGVVFPLLAIIAATLFTNRYLATRHLIPLLPLLLWEAARGLRTLTYPLGQKMGRTVFWMTGLALAVFWFSQILVQQKTTDKPPWRDIALHLAEIQREGSLFLATGDNVSVLGYYQKALGKHFRLHVVKQLDFNQDSPDTLQGIVVSGQENGGEEVRKTLERKGLRPTLTWESKRIAPIEYYDLTQ